jgi:hypothetical protein
MHIYYDGSAARNILEILPMSLDMTVYFFIDMLVKQPESLVIGYFKIFIQYDHHDTILDTIGSI